MVVDPWEDHCVECGEPECFKTCPKFRRGAHGRCERVLMRGEDGIKFLEWGKLELLWHGKLATRRRAEWIRKWNRRLEPLARFFQWMLGWIPLPYGKGPYGIFRSIRWRAWRMLADVQTAPTMWRVEAKSEERDVALAFEVRDADLNILVSHVATVGSGLRMIEIELPKVPEGALFSIRPVDGSATGWIRLLRNELVAEQRKNVKCVAWDLDGVLWSGTLSEGDDVKIDDSVMAVVKELDARGIVNSICSKNDATEAIEKLKALGVEEWFVFPQINWGPKSESLRRLAAEMNIGLDAIAFVDDREENRNEVRQALPEVMVISESDVSSLVSRLVSSASIGPGALGSDRRRMYREEMARRGAAAAFDGDAEAFSAASGLEIELLTVGDDLKDRCVELLQRTNQLNLTARRYDRAAFEELLKSSECRAVRVHDRYGDYGIVGFVSWRGTHLVECCFSCRVAKRGVERKVLDAISGGAKFTADVVETKRNAPIREIVEEWLVVSR